MRYQPADTGRYVLSRRRSPYLSKGDHRYRVEPLAPGHLPLVVPMLSQALPDSLLVSLGPRFLEKFLDSYVSLPGGFGYSCCHGEDVIGFVVGTEDSRRHRRALLRRRWAPILLNLLHDLVVSPRRARELARYLRSYLPLLRPPATNHHELEGVGSVPPASLVLLAVSPAHRRRGIAERLMRAFLSEMAERGVETVKLAVAADNKEALSLYLSRGWRVAGIYPAPGGNSACRLICRLA